RQMDPEAFRLNTVDRGADSDNRWRGMIGSSGEFRINPRWTFGWDVLVQSDKNFSHTYDIAGFNQVYRHDEVYLTGLSGRNLFDLRFMRFQVQEAAPDTGRTGVPNPNARNPRQPWVLPALDYAYTPDQPVFGG